MPVKTAAPPMTDSTIGNSSPMASCHRRDSIAAVPLE